MAKSLEIDSPPTSPSKDSTMTSKTTSCKAASSSPNDSGGGGSNGSGASARSWTVAPKLYPINSSLVKPLDNAHSNHLNHHSVAMNDKRVSTSKILLVASLIFIYFLLNFFDFLWVHLIITSFYFFYTTLHFFSTIKKDNAVDAQILLPPLFFSFSDLSSSFFLSLAFFSSFVNFGRPRLRFWAFINSLGDVIAGSGCHRYYLFPLIFWYQFFPLWFFNIKYNVEPAHQNANPPPKTEAAALNSASDASIIRYSGHVKFMSRRWHNSRNELLLHVIKSYFYSYLILCVCFRTVWITWKNNNIHRLFHDLWDKELLDEIVRLHQIVQKLLQGIYCAPIYKFHHNVTFWEHYQI